MSDSMASASQRKRHTRSPSYPGINLQRAIDRARELFEHERQYPTPVASAVGHWGYNSLSGVASIHLAALKKFGLIDDEGSKDERRVRISDLAMKIMLHPVDHIRAEGIREAALLPTAHRELWTKYGADLPSDRTLLWELTREVGFSESGAREFIKEYRETIDFADLRSAPPSTIPTGLTDDDVEFELEPEPVETSASALFDELPRPSPSGTARSTQSPVSQGSAVFVSNRPRMPRYQIPLLGGGQVAFEGPFPLTDAQWKFMMTVLEAMKPGLTAEPEFAIELDGIRDDA